MDFALSSNYDHGKEFLPEKLDIVLQPQTMKGVVIMVPDKELLHTLMHNIPNEENKTLPRAKSAVSFKSRASEKGNNGSVSTTKLRKDKKINMPDFVDDEFIVLSGYGSHLDHPVRIGGLVARNSPHSVKLINSAPHTHLTNPGYSRQTLDGNVFRY